jgi:hypothetical protein
MSGWYEPGSFEEPACRLVAIDDPKLELLGGRFRSPLDDLFDQPSPDTDQASLGSNPHSIDMTHERLLVPGVSASHPNEARLGFGNEHTLVAAKRRLPSPCVPRMGRSIDLPLVA